MGFSPVSVVALTASENVFAFFKALTSVLSSQVESFPRSSCWTADLKIFGSISFIVSLIDLMGVSVTILFSRQKVQLNKSNLASGS